MNTFARQNISFHSGVDENIPPLLFGDTLHITQILEKFITNAIKFKSERRPEIVISATENEKDILFTIRDNGIGISQQYADKIFVIFQRLHSRDKYPGTGIGLAICKKIVERHEGKIWVESTEGQGSTFCFSIAKKLE